MTPTQQLFLRRTELCKQLQAVSHTDWFAECCVYALNIATEQGKVTSDFLEGARTALEVLGSMGNPEPPDVPAVTSGIRHDFDRAREKKETQEPQKKD